MKHLTVHTKEPNFKLNVEDLKEIKATHLQHGALIYDEAHFNELVIRDERTYNFIGSKRTLSINGDDILFTDIFEAQ